MSLDWFPGQKVAFVHVLDVEDYVFILFTGLPAPVAGVAYTVHEAKICPMCNSPHISLEEIGPQFMYPHEWFKPLEPKEMSVLRGLLTPAGGLPKAPTLPPLKVPEDA